MASPLCGPQFSTTIQTSTLMSSNGKCVVASCHAGWCYRWSNTCKIHERGKAASLASALEADFYAPQFAIEEAIARRSHFNVIQVYEIQEPDLDQAYLDRWAAWLGVTDLLTHIRAEGARPPDEK